MPEALRSVIDALPDSVVAHFPQRGIVCANAAFLAFVGRADGLDGVSLLDLVHPEDRARVRDRIGLALESHRPTEPAVIRFLRGDGSTIEGECRASTCRAGGDDVVIALVRELRDQKRVASALERSEALFRTLIGDLRVGVLVQSRSAEILVSNRAALELLGLDEMQLLGKTSFDPDWNVAHEDGTPFPGPEHPVPTAIRTGRPVRGVVMAVYRPKRKDRVWLLVDAEPQLDAEGNVAQVVCTFSDITERRRLMTQATAADRLASMGRLAAGVAHEINNPLAYVVGHLEALRDAPLDAALHSKVEEALEGTERVRAIVEDLRSLSRGDDARHGPVDIVRVIDSACSIAAAHVRHRARLIRDLSPVPMVEGNESRLGQLVLNLIINAAEAIPEGRAADNEVRVRVHADARRVVLEVSDTGEGIPSDAIDRIFDPFFTTKPMGAGTGLGLSICHGIVTSLGGEIDVDSKVGRGSTFRVSLLPASAAVAEPPSSAASEAPASRILIVDDDRRVGEVLVTLLSAQHDVALEVRASKALERLVAGERYDVIFCDLMMPDINGMDFQAELEARMPEMAARTVFMTGGAFTARAQAFLDRFAGRVVEKPFRFAELERAIDKAARHVPCTSKGHGPGDRTTGAPAPAREERDDVEGDRIR